MGNFSSEYLNLNPDSNDGLTAEKIYFDRTQTIKQKIDSMAPRTMQINRILKNELNGWVDVGYFAMEDNPATLIFNLVIAAPDFNISKQYILSLNSAEIIKNKWYKVIPVSIAIQSVNNDVDTLILWGTDNNFYIRLNRSSYNTLNKTNYEASLNFLTYTPMSLNFTPVDDRGVFENPSFETFYCLNTSHFNYKELPLKEYLESKDVTLIPNIINASSTLQNALDDVLNTGTEEMKNLTLHLKSINENINAKINNLIKFTVQNDVKAHTHKVEEIKGLINIVNKIVDSLASETRPGLISGDDKKKLNRLKFYMDKLDPSVIPSVSLGNVFYCDRNEIYFREHLIEFVNGANKGDICLNSIEHKTYLLMGSDWSNSSQWVVFENFPYITDINQLIGNLPVTRIEGNVPFTKVSGNVPFTRISGLPEYFPVDPSTLGTSASRDVGIGEDNVILGNDSRLADSRKCNNTFDNIETTKQNLQLGTAANHNVGTGLNDVVLGNDPRLHNTTFSVNPPVGGNEGDIWYQYEI